MIVSLTDEGLRALAENKTLVLQQFIAGSSRTLASMEEWFSDPRHYTGSYKYYAYPVLSSHLYLKGDSYTQPDGTIVTVEDNFLEVIGNLDCEDVTASFTMYSLAVTAMVGDDASTAFIYAFGSISSSDKPYPINKGEAVTYVTPIKIFYNNAPDVTTEESGVPWKNFIQHADMSVNSEEGVHGLKINPNTKELTVGDTTIILSGGDERIAELEEEVQGILKYHQQDTREYNTELVSRMDGDGTTGSPYNIYTPLDFYNARLEPTACYKIINNLDLYPLIGIRARATDEGPEILHEYDNPDALCYNNGTGWENWEISGGCTFDGNGKYIKNLFIGRKPQPAIGGNWDPRYSLFRRVLGSNTLLTNMKLIDSVILAGIQGDTDNCYPASFCDRCEGSLTNCYSNADIFVYTDRSFECAGICISCDERSHIEYNTFQGTLTKMTGSLTSGYISGIIANLHSSAAFNGNYSDCTINFGDWRGGLLAGDHYRNHHHSNYFSGYVYNVYENPRNATSIACGTDVRDAERWEFFKYAFSRENSAGGLVQGNVRSAEYMMSRDFVSELNLYLPEPRFVYREGSFPRLDYEEDNTPYNSPIATIDTNTNFVLDSGYTVRVLSHMATQRDLSILAAALQSTANQKSRVDCPQIIFDPANWDNNNEYWWRSDYFDYASSTNNCIPIPTDYEYFVNGLWLNWVGLTNHEGVEGIYAVFGCNTVPQTSITCNLMIIHYSQV